MEYCVHFTTPEYQKSKIKWSGFVVIASNEVQAQTLANKQLSANFPNGFTILTIFGLEP